MEAIGEFFASRIDQEDESENEKEEISDDTPPWRDTIAYHKILQLKSNVVARGIIPLEKIFDKNDVPIKITKHV